MVQATIRMYSATDGHVEIKGHAGDALVCASVSTMVGSTLNVMSGAVANVVYDSGDVEFDVHFTDSIQMGAFEVLVEALEMLAESFCGRVGVTLEKPPVLG